MLAGTINQNGAFTMTAQKVWEKIRCGAIIRMVQEAQGTKAPVQRIVDKVTAVFVPVVLAVAVFTFLVWIVAGGADDFSHACFQQYPFWLLPVRVLWDLLLLPLDGRYW